LPGGIVDYGESLEYACMREIEEEIGVTIEPVDEFDLANPKYHMTSILRDNDSNPIPVTFKPYYLYESVTKNILDIDDHENEEFPPKS
jgi:8-oxo-dGTP pyrophosphatase MutT (NUDIX family)